MKLAVAAFGIATLVGVGYVIGRKVLEKKQMEDDFGDINDIIEDDEDDEPIIYAKQSYSDKFRKGAMFAVGAIKTGADKFGETIQDIKTKDMIRKGEATMDAVKETGENIKNDIRKDIDDLKNMVSSINDDVTANAEDLFDEVKEDIFGEDDAGEM